MRDCNLGHDVEMWCGLTGERPRTGFVQAVQGLSLGVVFTGLSILGYQVSNMAEAELRCYKYLALAMPVVCILEYAPSCPWVPSAVRFLAAVSGSSIRILAAAFRTILRDRVWRGAFARSMGGKCVIAA